MTPGARVAAAIEILDDHLTGAPVEKLLTTWGRTHRFAGSKDRAAIRDLVFTAVRRRKSAGAFNDNATGRLWMIGVLHSTGQGLDALFNGQGHAPAPIDDAERQAVLDLPQGVIDLQDWVYDNLIATLDVDRAAAIARVLQDRAPVTLRVNVQKATRADVMTRLAHDGIKTAENPLSDTAVTVLTNPRRVAQSDVFDAGLFELQDAASQAVAENIPASGRILDYCAGGGGKALAIAARTGATVFAHDIEPARMADIEPRATRAGHDIMVVTPDQLPAKAPFDTVFCDVPCSGSGAWRRSPESKWSLTPDALNGYVDLQRTVVRDAMAHLAPGGMFCFATCSLFGQENQEQRDWISEEFPGLQLLNDLQFLPSDAGDGLYLAVYKSK